MQLDTVLLCSLAAICLAVGSAGAVRPTRPEMEVARHWFDARFGPKAQALPFSFTYDGRPSADLTGWKVTRASRKLDRNRTEETTGWSDPQTGLTVRRVAVRYADYPTVEWTLYLRNDGKTDTPIIEKLLPLDARFAESAAGNVVLHHNHGSQANKSDYGPIDTPLAPDSTFRFGAAGGRPTNSDWSYWSLDWGGAGAIVVVGWPGQWSAELTRDAAPGVLVRAGQELTHFRLHPGEEVRTPLILVQHWAADPTRAQNVWRRWMMAYGMPKPGGKLPAPMMVASSSRAYEEMIHADEASQIMHIDRYLEERFPLAYWWMDAGWYIQQHGWPQVGTWEVDPARFPHGFKAISDHAHARGVKILVWFEPERVAADTWLSNNHPEWILGGKGGGLLNLGNPDAWHWLVEHIDKLITDNGIDLYRQDFNMDPLALWRAADAPDRQGITEIKHVTGYLAYWDELRRRHPNMLIDSCASGGRRNDLETMRRSVPLWRSDYAYEAIGHQCMTYGISQWLPYHGTGTVATANAPYYGGGATPVEPYAFWSNAAPSLGCGVDVRVKELDYGALRKLFGEWQSVGDLYYGDYYPLTPYTQANDAWIGWQFDRPEKGDGVVQAFRRGDCPQDRLTVKLGGLVPSARYTVANVDGSDVRQSTGRDLMQKGLELTSLAKPGAVVVTYRRVR